MLFGIAVIIFGFASWIAVRYAQGFVFDFRTNMFVHTGAVAVGVNTSDTRFVVDEKYVGSSSLLSRTIGEDRLIPGTYTIQLTKEQWSGWKKQAIVQEGLLTEFPNVLLLPMDEESRVDLRAEASRSFGDSITLALAPKTARGVPQEIIRNGYLLRGTTLHRLDPPASSSMIAEGVLGFAPANGGDQVIWWTRNDVWAMWRESTNYQPYRTAGERLLVSRITSPIIRAAWFRGRDHVVLQTGTEYRVVETDTRGGTNTIRF